MNDTLEMFVVYDHPSDFPHSYVVRRVTVEAGRTRMDLLPKLICADLEAIRSALRQRGIVTNIGRFPQDDPVILEVWIR